MGLMSEQGHYPFVGSFMQLFISTMFCFLFFFQVSASELTWTLLLPGSVRCVSVHLWRGNSAISLISVPQFP